MREQLTGVNPAGFFWLCNPVLKIMNLYLKFTKWLKWSQNDFGWYFIKWCNEVNGREWTCFDIPNFQLRSTRRCPITHPDSSLSRHKGITYSILTCSDLKHHTYFNPISHKRLFITNKVFIKWWSNHPWSWVTFCVYFLRCSWPYYEIFGSFMKFFISVSSLQRHKNCWSLSSIWNPYRCAHKTTSLDSTMMMTSFNGQIDMELIYYSDSDYSDTFILAWLRHRWFNSISLRVFNG